MLSPHQSPLCPRCRERPRRVTRTRIDSYCKPCTDAYQAERKQGSHRVVRLDSMSADQRRIIDGLGHLTQVDQSRIVVELDRVTPEQRWMLAELGGLAPAQRRAVLLLVRALIDADGAVKP